MVRCGIRAHSALGWPFAGLSRAALAALVLPIALAACGNGGAADRNIDSLDAELADGNSSGNTRDPAMMSALQQQIMVDPALASQANYDAIRPPAQPYSAPAAPEMMAVGRGTTGTSTSETLKSAPAPVRGQGCPKCSAARESLTLGGLAERQSPQGTSACAANINYSTGWANRLPGDVPLYPDARVREAAGADSQTCALRVVSFASTAPLQTVLDWYYTRLSKVGYSAEHQADGDDHVLAGTKGEAAFAVFASVRTDGGTDVDLVVNRGN